MVLELNVLGIVRKLLVFYIKIREICLINKLFLKRLLKLLITNFS